MDLTHRFTVPAPVDEAWTLFNDVERVAPCFPGAALTSYDGTAFAGLVKVKLGPISLQYSGTGTVTERDEAEHRAVIEAKGKDKRGNGTAAATVTARLQARDDGATDVEVLTSLNITGKPAQFGRGVMQEVGDKMLAQFASCLESRLAGGGTSEAEASPPPPATEAPATEEPATKAPAAGAPAKKVPPKKVPPKKTAAKKAPPKKAPAKKSAKAATGAPATKAAERLMEDEPVAPTEPVTAVQPVRQAEPVTVAETGGKAEPVKRAEPSPDPEPSLERVAARSAGGDDRPFTTAFHEPVALDLGRTVLPILAKRLAPVIAALVGVIVLWRLTRRR